MRDAAPDVVALQECSTRNHFALLEGGGWHTRRTPRFFLASRWRILRVEELGKNSVRDRGAVARYEVDAPAGVLTLFSLHLASPRDGLYETVHQKEEGVVNVEDNAALRWRQSRFIAGEARKAHGPLLLVGDFNTPPESALFRQVWRDWTDAFGEAGWGWGYTFHGNRTAVRIDHVLAGPGWECRRCWVGPRVGSPHQPVLADLVWQQPGEAE